MMSATGGLLQRTLIGLLLSVLPACVLAQEAVQLPVPSESYGEDDPFAVSPRRIDLSDARALKTLEQILQYDPENVGARIQNAQVLIGRGMRQRGLDEFAYAMRLAKGNDKLLRQVHWNYGWALFNVGEPRLALTQWMQAERMHGGRPIWVPSTYAVGLWVAGDRELALEFYKSAVRSNPRRWGESNGLADATRDWNANEKLAIEAVYASWRQQIGRR